MLPYFLLALSIGLELFATTMLKASDGCGRYRLLPAYVAM